MCLSMKRVGWVLAHTQSVFPSPLQRADARRTIGLTGSGGTAKHCSACAAAGLSHIKHRGVHCASSSVDRQGAIGCRAVTSTPRFPACAAAATCLMSSNLWHQLLYIHRAAERQTTAYKKLIQALLKMNGSTNVFSAFLNLVQVQCCTQFSPLETQEKILKLLKFQVDTVRGLMLLV